MIGSRHRMTASLASVVGQQQYAAAGSGNFTVPAGVTSICAVVIGGGAGTASNVNGIGSAYRGGSSGALTYRNNIAVTPGQVIAYVVGGGGAPGSDGTGSSLSIPGSTMLAAGGVGSGSTVSSSGGDVNRFGGVGGYTTVPVSTPALGRGGRASYAGNASSVSTPEAETGGGASGGAITINGTGYGSCVFENLGDTGASLVGDVLSGRVGAGGYVANSGGAPLSQAGNDGGIRIIWGPGRSYPSNAS